MTAGLTALMLGFGFICSLSGIGLMLSRRDTSTTSDLILLVGQVCAVLSLFSVWINGGF